MTDKPPSGFPQSDRLTEVADERDTIRHFLDWVGETHRAQLASIPTPDTHRLYPLRVNVETLLDEHFGIDAVALEQERRSMLDMQRQLNDDAAVGYAARQAARGDEAS